MSEQETRRLAEQFTRDVWNVDGNLDVADAILADDFVEPGLPADFPFAPTREGHKQQAAMYRSALNLTTETQDIIVEDDRAAIHWRARGTQADEFFGVPPTGKAFDIQGVTLIRVRDGQIVEARAIADRLGLMQQLGAIPVPGQSGG